MSVVGKRIEICGGIASGKTTLASILKETTLIAVFERFDENPFWEKFYRDPKKYAFETEITFLLQHYSQFRDSMEDNGFVVCDCSTLLDMAYADVNLQGGKYEAFVKVYDEVILAINPPNILIHLECSAADEQRRIRARAREEEQVVSVNYLSALNDAVRRRVNLLPSSVRVLQINSSEVDFATDPSGRDWARRRVMSATEDVAGSS